MSKDAERQYLAKIGESGRLHSLNKPFSDQFGGINLASIGFLISLLPPPPARLLDLGCGGGWTSVFFAKCGYDVVGQDISSDMIAVANEAKEVQAIGDNLSFLQADYEGLNFSHEFDCVIFYDSLHHADDEKSALLSAYRALKKGGKLFTHEPGKGHAEAPGSVEARAQYGVNERDMPPSLIISQGKTVGFQEFRIFPMPAEIRTALYGPPPPKLVSRAGLRLARRVLRMAFNPSSSASAIVMLVK